MAKIGIDPYVADRCLGHAKYKVAGICNRYQYEDERRAALEWWAVALDAIIGGTGERVQEPVGLALVKEAYNTYTKVLPFPRHQLPGKPYRFATGVNVPPPETLVPLPLISLSP
jgi:hypothetical protein